MVMVIFLFSCQEQLQKSRCLSFGREEFVKKIPLKYQMVTKTYLKHTYLPNYLPTFLPTYLATYLCNSSDTSDSSDSSDSIEKKK